MMGIYDISSHSLLQSWFKFWEVPENYPTGDLPLKLLRTAGLVGLYIILDRTLMTISELPASSYHSSFLFWGFLKNLFMTWHAVFLVPIIIIGFLFGKHLATSWEFFEKGHWLRLLIVLAAGSLAWMYSTYDYNLYHNQSHMADRILLLAIVPLIYWRPIFIFLFLTLLLSIIWQFEALPHYSWAMPYLPIRIMVLFGAFFLFYVLTKSVHITDFVLLVGSLFAAHYWVPGSGKLNQWWLVYDQIHFLLPATYANGWLGFLDPDMISSIASIWAKFNLPLKVFTITLECGMVFFFWRRYLALTLITGVILMNLGVLGISGICFWMWLIMQAGLLVLFIRKDAFAGLPVFTKPHFILSVFLIVGSTYWLRPVKLSWLDVPLSYTYRFEATTSDNKVYILPPQFFAPFDFQFTTGIFKYLEKDLILPVSWGATGDMVMASWFLEPRSSEQIFKYEKTHGKLYYDEQKVAAFDAFLYQFIHHWNERLTKNLWLEKFQAPRFYWTYPNMPAFDPPMPIQKLVVCRVTSYFSQGQYEEISKVPIHEVSIP